MINRVVLVGRLTRDPDLKYLQNGTPVCAFTLAVNRSFKKENGEQEADFINIVVWRKAAENAANFLKKGSLAGIDGRIQTRNYEGQDGKRVYVTEVVAESIQFLEPKSKSDGDSSQRNGTYTNGGGNSQSQSQGFTRVDDPFAGSGSIDINDDDLPF